MDRKDLFSVHLCYNSAIMERKDRLQWEDLHEAELKATRTYQA